MTTKLRGLAALAILFASLGSAASAATNGSTQITFKTNIIAQMTVTPNYASGYGPTGGSGSGSTPTPGPSAAAGSGYVDFGKVVAGYNYLYRNAAQVGVLSNDANGFEVYAEGTTDFSDGGSNTVVINGTLYWLASNGSNTPFSNATSFSRTTFPITGSGSTTGINYGGSTPPASALVWTYPNATIGQPSNTATQGYDYELRLPYNAPTAVMTLYVVYSVILN